MCWSPLRESGLTWRQASTKLYRFLVSTFSRDRPFHRHLSHSRSTQIYSVTLTTPWFRPAPAPALNRSPRTASSPASHTGPLRRVRQIEPLLQEIHTQHTFHSHGVAARSPLSDSVALSARTARATGPPASSLPETPLVVSFLCTAQNHSSSPESFVVCLSISSGGNLLYIPVERETLFRVSLEAVLHWAPVGVTDVSEVGTSTGFTKIADEPNGG